FHSVLIYSSRHPMSTTLFPYTTLFRSGDLITTRSPMAVSISLRRKSRYTQLIFTAGFRHHLGWRNNTAQIHLFFGTNQLTTQRVRENVDDLHIDKLANQ